tara:strand:- start:1935 stop:3257 length:1323 start_codon:yes stop_codon:yes gene_type:complete
MIIQSKKLLSLLFLLIPFFLITGPAIPDIVITLGILFGIFYILYLKEYENLIKLNLFRISIIFWLSLILISFFAYNKINSFQDSLIFVRFLLIPLFCYFIFFKDNKVFEKSLLIIFVLVVFVSIDTLYQFMNYTSKDGFGKDLLGFKSNWYGRLTGPFGDELIPGSYLSKFGLFGFVFLISVKKLENNIIIQSIYLSFIIFVCYVSGERMAFATFSLSLLFLFLFLGEFRKSILLSIFFGASFILLVTYLHPFYNDFNVIESTQYHQGQKIEKFYQCENNTNNLCSKIINIQPNFSEIIINFGTSAYGEIYKLSYKMFLDNPLTGIGINNFKYLCDSKEFYTKIMVNYDCASHPHNIYIQWFTEGGIIVFICFILYLYYLIIFIINNTGDKKNKIISIVIILSMFWPIMSTGSLIKNWYGVTTFFIIGMCLCLSRFKNNY